MTSCRRRKNSSLWTAATIAALVGAAGCGVDASSEMGAGGKSLIAVDDCRDGHCLDSPVDGQEIIASPSNATPCTTPGQCPNGFCFDNVCCDKKCTGSCQACTAAKKGAGADGTCGYISNGLDPDDECQGTCNGFGSCAKSGILFGYGSPCSMGSECSSNLCVDGVCCNSSCTGTCQACTAAKKGSGSDGICGNIAVATDPDNECPTDNCNGAGMCGPPGMSTNGTACTSGSTCSSGNCVDGVCCDSACTATCQACSAAKKASGANGICGTIAAATDPDNECPLGSCNSFGSCGPGLLLGNAAACNSAGQCSSGFCVDGVCCNNACTGSCDACNVAGSQGACSNACVATVCPGGFGLPGWPSLPLANVAEIREPNAYMDHFSADVNGDGLVDFIAVWLGTNQFQTFLNIGGGRFAAPTVTPLSNATLAYVVDMNGDGFADLVTRSSTVSPIGVHLNLGNGTFAPKLDYTVVGTTLTMRVADVNGDLLPDLVIEDRGIKKVGISLNQGNGTFGTRVDYPVDIAMGGAEVADINGDGQRDLVFFNLTTANTLSMLINQGNGTFGARIDKPLTLTENARLSSGDIDGDGDVDLAFRAGTTIKVAFNLGSLNFAAPTTVNVGWTVGWLVVADVTGDGKPELIANTAVTYPKIAVLENNGSGGFSSPVLYAIGKDPSDPKAVDIDADGNVDIAFADVHGANITLLRNKGDGTFAVKTDLPAGSTPGLILAVDVSGDGQPDLVSAERGPSRLNVRINQGAGQFPTTPVSYILPSGPDSAAAGDFNGDGLTDIVVGSYSAATISIFLNQGGGTFAPMISHSAAAWSLATKDLNGDGLDDIVVGGGSASVQVLMNQGNVTFAMGQTISGWGTAPLALGDVNGDGIDDLVVAIASSTPTLSAAVMFGLGNGQFGPASMYVVGALGSGVALQDLDADGFPEMIISHAYLSAYKAPQPTEYHSGTADSHASIPSNGLSIFHNNGNGTFTKTQVIATGVGPASVATGDINRDGTVDVVVSNTVIDPPETSSGTISVFLNDGTGKLAPRIDFPGEPNAIASGDLNGDGAMDIAMGTQRATIGVLLNTCLP